MTRFLAIVGVSLMCCSVAASEDSEMVLPELVHKVNPRPPASFRNVGIEAEVVLNAYLNEDGSVATVELSSCKSRAPGDVEFRAEPEKRCKPFVKSATDAVMQWKYRPATQGGKPIATWYLVRMSFVHGR